MGTEPAIVLCYNKERDIKERPALFAAKAAIYAPRSPIKHKFTYDGRDWIIVSPLEIEGTYAAIPHVRAAPPVVVVKSTRRRA